MKRCWPPQANDDGSVLELFAIQDVYHGAGSNIITVQSPVNSVWWRAASTVDNGFVTGQCQIHPDYDGGDITFFAPWFVDDASHGTPYDMRWRANFIRVNTDSMDVNPAQHNYQVTDTASWVPFDNPQTFTPDGTFDSAGTLLWFEQTRLPSVGTSGNPRFLYWALLYYID